MKNRVAILAGVVWHQYANLVFSIHLDFKRLHDLHGRIQIRSIPVHAVHVSVEAAGETCQRYEYWLAEDFGVMAIPTQQTR